MKTFVATEFDAATLQPTERREFYGAATVEEAVRHVLYTHRATNGLARVGPTGKCVYDGPFAYAVTEEKT